MLRKAKVGASIVPMFVTTGKCSSEDGRGGWLERATDIGLRPDAAPRGRRRSASGGRPGSAERLVERDREKRAQSERGTDTISQVKRPAEVDALLVARLRGWGELRSTALYPAASLS